MQLAINTIEELQQAIRMQRTATAKTILELHGAVTCVDDPVVAAAQVIHLLSSYAVLPTLTEHQKSMPMRGAYKQGATFGVALIVGELMLKQVRQVTDSFPRAHLMLLIHLLSGMQPGVDAAELLAGYMTFGLEEGLSPLQKQEQTVMLVSQLADTLMGIAEQYQLIETLEPLHSTVTPLGLRVALHLLDAHQFVNDVVEAHQRFQP
jgi:hypothetical protein